jgi:hypothetical protein
MGYRSSTRTALNVVFWIRNLFSSRSVRSSFPLWRKTFVISGCSLGGSSIGTRKGEQVRVPARRPALPNRHPADAEAGRAQRAVSSSAMFFFAVFLREHTSEEIRPNGQRFRSNCRVPIRIALRGNVCTSCRFRRGKGHSAQLSSSAFQHPAILKTP